MGSQLTGMAMQMTTMSSYQEIIKSVAGSTQVMTRLNEDMDIASI